MTAVVAEETAEPHLSDLLDRLNGILLGKDRELRLALACLLARGHLLIDGLPGVGKTTLAQGLASELGLDFRRVQFTSDLLPADVLGVSVYDRQVEGFRFHPGPIFTQLLLADEINRAPPRTQSALLEAMEERQVTVEGKSHALPEPFFVIASQNPHQQIGTFPLPESQLDRFLARVPLGYPNAEAERALFQGEGGRSELGRSGPLLSPEILLIWQGRVEAIHVAPALLDYVQALLTHSRDAERFAVGLSPRAGLGLIAMARAWTYLHGRRAVEPEDVQAVVPALVEHRLQALDRGLEQAGLGQAMIESVAVP